MQHQARINAMRIPSLLRSPMATLRSTFLLGTPICRNGLAEGDPALLALRRETLRNGLDYHDRHCDLARCYVENMSWIGRSLAWLLPYSIYMDWVVESDRVHMESLQMGMRGRLAMMEALDGIWAQEGDAEFEVFREVRESAARIWQIADGMLQHAEAPVGGSEAENVYAFPDMKSEVA